MEIKISAKERRHLNFFFIATLAWTWIIGMIPVMLGIHDTLLGEYIFVFTAGIAPSCVGVFMVFKTYTKAARIDYFKRFIPSFKGIWYVIAYGSGYVFIMTILLSLVLKEFPDYTMWNSFLSKPTNIILFIFFLYLYGPANEEFGWRGYALDKLLVNNGFLKGSLILGFIWGIWHLPWIFYASQWQSQSFQISPLWFIIFILQCMASSLIISIGYILSKRNLFTAATLHGIGNSALGLIYLRISLKGGNLAQFVIIGLGLMILGLAYIVFGKKFKTLCAQEIRSLCEQKAEFGMLEVYADRENTERPVIKQAFIDEIGLNKQEDFPS